jgi:pyruvate/oxaloacetate carboxyltransferase/uncharacterized small protein (DUF1192 family)
MSQDRIAPDAIFPAESGACRLNSTAVRDWPQSNLGWMHPDHVYTVVEKLKPYYDADNEKFPGAMEVGGGTIPRSHLLNAGVSPYDHIRQVRAKVGRKVPLMALIRSNAGAAMNDMPADIVKDYIRRYHDAGIDVFRNFHSHNDPRQFKNVYEAVRDVGGHFQAAYSWSVFNDDPTVYNPKTVVNFFRELEREGIKPDSFVLKDPSGVLTPSMARLITREMKKAFPDKPFGIHTHDQCGYAAASGVAAAKEGANFVDCAPSTGGRSAQPPMPGMFRMLQDEGIGLGAHVKDARRVKKMLGEVDEQCAAIAPIYQTASYAKPESAPGAAVKHFYDEVLGTRFTAHTDVEEHGMAGGQSALAYDELKKNGILQKLPELWEGMEKTRKAAGATCPVTPAADRFFREAARIVNGGDPDGGFYRDYAQELTGEAGPTKVEIDPAKQRAALLERVAWRRLDGIVDDASMKTELLANKSALLEKLVDHMREVYAPVHDVARLQEVSTRLSELEEIRRDAKSDKDYEAYARQLSEKIAQSSLAGQGVTDLNGVIGMLRKEQAQLKARLPQKPAEYDVMRQHYETLQKAKDGALSDDLYNQMLPEGSGVRKALESVGLRKEQIVELMKAATVSTCVASDLMEPGLDKARQGLRVFAKDKNCSRALDPALRAEEVSIWAMFGGDPKSIAAEYFAHRDDARPFWKTPGAQERPAPARHASLLRTDDAKPLWKGSGAAKTRISEDRPSLSGQMGAPYVCVGGLGEMSPVDLYAALWEQWQKYGGKKESGRVAITSDSSGITKITMPPGSDISQYSPVIKKAIEALGGKVITYKDYPEAGRAASK